MAEFLSELSLPECSPAFLSRQLVNRISSTSLSASSSIVSIPNQNRSVNSAEARKPVMMGSPTDETEDKNNYNSFSAFECLGKILAKQLVESERQCSWKLIVATVHNVMMGAGLVGFRNNVGMRSFRFKHHNCLSVCYTLPEACRGAYGRFSPRATLRFQKLENFLIVYGAIDSETRIRHTHRIELNMTQLLPVLKVVCKYYGVIKTDDRIINGLDLKLARRDTNEFWTRVKDNIAYPLLMDLKEDGGLESPPCFMELPDDLLLRILEFLRGVDVARVSCVCLKLRDLASSGDLWKQKYQELVGMLGREPPEGWRVNFANFWGRVRQRPTPMPRNLPPPPGPRSVPTYLPPLPGLRFVQRNLPSLSVTRNLQRNLAHLPDREGICFVHLPCICTYERI